MVVMMPRDLEILFQIFLLFFLEKVGLSEAKGAYVLSVLPDSPASRVKINPRMS